MAGIDDEIAAAVRAFSGRERRRRPIHVSPEDLLAYRAGQLAAAEREPIRDHLALCARCAELFLDLEGSGEDELVDAARGLSAADLDRRWESFRERLGAEPDPLGLPAAREPRPLLWFSGALAASLLATSLGLAFWASRLEQRLAALSRPAVRVAVSELFPETTSVERTVEAAEATHLPGWADRLVLVLHLFEPHAYPAYEVEIFAEGRGGRPVWASREVRRAPDGSFAMEVPRGFLPAGRYRIELSGSTGSRKLRLATYPLLLEVK